MVRLQRPNGGSKVQVEKRYFTLLTYLLTHSPAYLLTHLLIYSLIHSHTYLLSLWSRVLIEKLTGPKSVKKFPTFYGTPRLITAFASAPHLTHTEPDRFRPCLHIPLPEDPS